jgi:hypothetical protein
MKIWTEELESEDSEDLFEDVMDILRDYQADPYPPPWVHLRRLKSAE